MIAQLKLKLYFPIAWYFRFFASIRLKKWNPRILVVTGSNGKTTLLHLLEAQIGKRAKYSHHANSSFGIPFDILGLQRETLLKSEWISLFLKAPFAAFNKPPAESLYIVEADCDRPGEGEFLASFLKPEVVLWVSTARTHALQFDKVMRHSHFKTVEEAIANEFGYFLQYAKKYAVINGDSELQKGQIKRTKAEVNMIKKSDQLESYYIDNKGSSFKIDKIKYSFSAMLPEEVFYLIAMCKKAVEYLGFEFDNNFPHFQMPPGRGSLFKGINNITIIDSCYNANLASMTAILEMYKKFSAEKKWAVIGDMLEQGSGEKAEHEKLAEILAAYNFEKLILMGPRVSEYTYPLLVKSLKLKVQSDEQGERITKYENPKDVLDYIINNIQGGETILFKGARFMEGIIENLLLDKKDAAKLVRREKVWEIRRRKWGL